MLLLLLLLSFVSAPKRLRVVVWCTRWTQKRVLKHGKEQFRVSRVLTLKRGTTRYVTI